MSFKSTHLFSDRLLDSTNILLKYPDRIPIICEKYINAPKDCPEIDKKKYLVPNDLTVAQFIYVIRKRLKLNAEKAIFIFINGYVPSGASLLCNLYDSHKDPDGYLYIVYTFENTFGL
jgi:GABA(A) receptor-associated protein